MSGLIWLRYSSLDTLTERTLLTTRRLNIYLKAQLGPLALSRQGPGVRLLICKLSTKRQNLRQSLLLSEPVSRHLALHQASPQVAGTIWGASLPAIVDHLGDGQLLGPTCRCATLWIHYRVGHTILTSAGCYSVHLFIVKGRNTLALSKVKAFAVAGKQRAVLLLA